jgi:hypothetical protein
VNPSSFLTLALATSVLPQLQAALEQSCCPCVSLKEQVSALVARFLTAPITPASTLDFETSLQLLLAECGRLVVQAAFHHVEPEDPQDAPKHTRRDRQDYSRKNAKSRNRGGIATLFGRIELRRCLYEPLQEARHDRQHSFSPLELCLGIVAGNATPGLAQRVGRLSGQHTQQEMLDLLRRDHQVSWSVEVLRKVTAAVSAGIAVYLLAAQQQVLLGWLRAAQQSRGRYRPVLAVGRDGVMVPIRDEETGKEAAVATLSVYDRRGRRLGTVYLGEMPQPQQVTLSAELTALVRGVLAGWEGPMPRLVYLTDAGHHQTAYFEEVLRRMKDPRRPGEPLAWLWVVDYWHAAGYVSRLAAVLFSDEQMRRAWSGRMRQVLKEQDRGVIRVLASAAQYEGKKALSAEQQRGYWEAYNYLLKHSKEMKYSEYRRVKLPIGSGVTEAGCKVVFTQRLKQSGMTWGLEGGEVILRLRLAVLSGVWDQVYRDYLIHRPLVPLATPLTLSPRPDGKVA